MQWLAEFTASAKQKLSQFNNATFKDASMAVCALIAAADGSVTPEEKKKVAAMIGSNELLSAFDPMQLKTTFESYCIKANDEFERIQLRQIIRKLKGNEEQADTAVRVALIIANADGSFSDAEKSVVGELCLLLGLNSSEYLS